MCSSNLGGAIADGLPAEASVTAKFSLERASSSRRLAESAKATTCDLSAYGAVYACGTAYKKSPNWYSECYVKRDNNGQRICGPQCTVAAGEKQCVTIQGKKVTTDMACWFKDLSDAATAAGATVKLNQGFRVMADQEHFYDCWKSAGAGNDPRRPPEQRERARGVAAGDMAPAPELQAQARKIGRAHV